jgi:hypothetical protein
VLSRALTQIQEFGYERTPEGIAKLLKATDNLLKSNVQVRGDESPLQHQPPHPLALGVSVQ